MGFEKILYRDLNSRQKEIYDFQKVSSILAEYGFAKIKLNNDWYATPEYRKIPERGAGMSVTAVVGSILLMHPDLGMYQTLMQSIQSFLLSQSDK